MAGNSPFPTTDWRFNEYPNPSAHCLYITSVELMSLPVLPDVVANNLMDVILQGFIVIPATKIQFWINTVGVIIASLPDPYWTVIHDKIFDLISSTDMIEWSYPYTPFQLFNLNVTNDAMLENKYSLTLALAHAIWFHANTGQIAQIPA